MCVSLVIYNKVDYKINKIKGGTKDARRFKEEGTTKKKYNRGFT